MKKFTIFTCLGILLAMLIALTACSDEPATLTMPDAEDDGIVYLIDHPMSGTDDDDIMLCEGDDNWDDDFFFLDDMPTFGTVTGQVTQVGQTPDGDLSLYINTGESSAHLHTHFNTFVMGEAPEVGTTVTGFFLLDRPMIMIYPPQYTVSVVVNNDDVQDDGIPFIFACRFFEFGEGQLKSTCGELVINLGGDTEVILQSGEEFDGDLVGRMLVVKYAISTRSLPPQTTPIQIVVLYEMPMTGPEMIDLPEDWDFEYGGFTHYDIVIDGEGLVGPLALFLEPDVNFQTHVELVPVAEFLGTEVNWDQATNEVTLTGKLGDITFTVGTNDFAVDGQVVTLHGESVDFYGHLFVPVLFFRDVFGMGAAYSFEGRIIINTEPDDMQ